MKTKQQIEEKLKELKKLLKTEVCQCGCENFGQDMIQSEIRTLEWVLEVQ